MVARFAEMFTRRGTFDFDTAVEQLTQLWAGAIGLRQTSSATLDAATAGAT
jgi:hypothetical protein